MTGVTTWTWPIVSMVALRLGVTRNTRLSETGIGWNLHNEQFLQGHPVLTTLRLKASYGETGSQQGSSTGASTTHKYSTDNKYMNWNGTIPARMGKPQADLAKRRMNLMSGWSSVCGQGV